MDVGTYLSFRRGYISPTFLPYWSLLSLMAVSFMAVLSNMTPRYLNCSTCFSSWPPASMCNSPNCRETTITSDFAAFSFSPLFVSTLHQMSTDCCSSVTEQSPSRCRRHMRRYQSDRLPTQFRKVPELSPSNTISQGTRVIAFQHCFTSCSFSTWSVSKTKGSGDRTLLASHWFSSQTTAPLRMPTSLTLALPVHTSHSCHQHCWDSTFCLLHCLPKFLSRYPVECLCVIPRMPSKFCHLIPSSFLGSFSCHILNLCWSCSAWISAAVLPFCIRRGFAVFVLTCAHTSWWYVVAVICLCNFQSALSPFLLYIGHMMAFLRVVVLGTCTCTRVQILCTCTWKQCTFTCTRTRLFSTCTCIRTRTVSTRKH